MVRPYRQNNLKSKNLSLQSINDIKRRHRLSLGMLRIRNSITNHTLKKNFENASGLFIDKTGDTLDSTTARETTNSRFRNSLLQSATKKDGMRSYGCCLAGFYDGVSHRLYQVLYHLFHVLENISMPS
jgi:hypothetical protein